MRLPRLGINHAAAADRVTAGLSEVVVNPSSLPYASPWADSTLNEILFDDIIGKGLAAPISRESAMRIPAAARGRNLMVSTVCRFPMYAMEGDARAKVQPYWMYGTAGPVHPMIRLAWTVDDLIWHGWSLWDRMPDGSPGSRVGRSRWYLNADMQVVVDGQVKRADEVILFAGLHEGVLSYGIDALSDAKALYRSVRQRIKNPSPQLMLKQVAGTALTDDQIDALIVRWAKAREGENGGVGFANQSIEVTELGSGDPALMIEARNAAALDIARMIGISGGKIDATTPKASLNYETTTGRNEEFVDTDVQLYMTPITARLSMDDIMPPGQRAAFDLTDFTAPEASPTGPAVQD